MAIKRLLRTFVGIWVGLAWLLIAPAVQASPAKNPQKTLQDVRQVRQKIHSLQKEISQQEKARQSAKRTILNAEKALKTIRGLVDELLKKKTVSQKRLSALYQDLQAIKQQMKNVQSHIALVLQKQYLHHRKNTSTKLLTTQEVSQQKRHQIYYQYITQAQNKLIQQMQNQQEKLKQLSASVERELKKLDVATRHKNNEEKKLEIKKINSSSQEKRLAKNIQTKKQRLATLLADEKRMTALVAELQRQINHQTTAQKAQISKKPPHEKNKQTAPRVTAAADASVSGKNFRLLKGKMKLPMIGSITGRFGAARGTEGASWKGIFISASPQQDVRAIADGKVIHTGYLKGFGKISIIDHGGLYFTMYMGLSSIEVSTGHKVRAGDKLGKSGSLDSGETGLYFEIRHMGKPVNPLSWTVF